MNSKCHTLAEWNFAPWFAVLSPVIGVLLGLFRAFDAAPRRPDGAARRPYQKRWFQRRRRHDPWLVLNMSIFNFQPGRNEIFNPLRIHENVWS